MHLLKYQRQFREKLYSEFWFSSAAYETGLMLYFLCPSPNAAKLSFVKMVSLGHIPAFSKTRKTTSLKRKNIYIRAIRGTKIQLLTNV